MLKNQKSKFSVPTGATYLNCAYMSPLMKSVEKVGVEGIRQKRNPFSISAADFFTVGEKLRKEFSKLINNPEPERSVIVPSVSYGLANVAKNVRLSSSDNMVLASEQFPSNYYPWHRLALETGAKINSVNPPNATEQRGKRWNEKILDAINRDTKIVAIGNVHWADGTRFDLKAIRERTRDVGALLVVDGTQSVGALPFDVSVIKPDALICAGYKWLLGPYSIGMAYYGSYFDGGIPVEESWINRIDSEDFAGLVNYKDGYQPGALRYEVGEHSNFILAPMMLEALKQVNAWKPAQIQKYCESIGRKAIDQLRENNFWIEEPQWRGHHLFGVRIPTGIDMSKLKARIRKNNISVSYRGNAIRVAPHLYNTEKELLKLAAVLISSR